MISDFGHGQDCYLFDNVLTSSVGNEFEIHRPEILQNNNRYSGMEGGYIHATYPIIITGKYNPTLVWKCKCLWVWIRWCMKIVNWYHRCQQCIKLYKKIARQWSVVNSKGMQVLNRKNKSSWYKFVMKINKQLFKYLVLYGSVLL